ncbi:MAG TPA: hypothetical protein VGM26_06685 [Rhizomicrobium sp.]|jgi:hypothetical protein
MTVAHVYTVDFQDIAVHEVDVQVHIDDAAKRDAVAKPRVAEVRSIAGSSIWPEAQCHLPS